MSIRDSIRAKTVGANKTFQKEIVEIDGLKVEVRQPTVVDRGLIIDGAGEIDPETKKVKVHTAKLQVDSVMACSFVAETGERLFEEGDRESIEKMPAGGWFDDLAKAAQRMINVDLDDAKNA